jgi:exodeoxyribonuclease VII small subunit
MSKNITNQTIAEKIEALESILAWFESEEITVEEAMEKYEQALGLANVLEQDLANAKNQVEVIKKKFSKRGV